MATNTTVALSFLLSLISPLIAMRSDLSSSLNRLSDSFNRLSFALRNQPIPQQPFIAPPLSKPSTNTSISQQAHINPTRPQIQQPATTPQGPQRNAQGISSIADLEAAAKAVTNQQQLNTFLNSFGTVIYDPKDKAKMVAILQNLGETFDRNRLQSWGIDQELLRLGAIKKTGLAALEKTILNEYQAIEKKFNSTDANLLVKDIETYIISGGKKNFSGRLETIQQLLRLDALALRIERLIKNNTDIATAFSSAQYGDITFNAISKEDKKFVYKRVEDVFNDKNKLKTFAQNQGLIESQTQATRKPSGPQIIAHCLPSSGSEVLYSSKADNTSEIIQLKSANQMAKGGGGAASCGYYAILNASSIIESIYNQTNYKNLITDIQTQHIDVYKIGPLADASTGKLVKAVLFYNYSRVVKGYIEDQMLACYTFETIANPDGLAATGIKRSQLRDAARAIIRTVARAEYQKLFGKVANWDINKALSITLSPQNITEEIQKDKYGSLINVNYNDLFKNTNQTLNLQFTPEQAREAYNKLHFTDPTQSIKYQGDWLDDNELRFLVDSFINPHFSKKNLPEISFTYVTQDELQWLDVTDQVAQLKKGIPVVFILGTQSQTGGGYSHWYTLVINKCSDKLQYIIADSWAQRGSQVNAHEVTAVINKINQSWS